MTINKIYYSHKLNISYANREVFINDLPIHTTSSQSCEEYAYQEMRNAYHDLLTLEHDNLIILVGDQLKKESGGYTSKELWQKVIERLGIDFMKDLSRMINYQDFDEDFTSLEDFMYRGYMAISYTNSDVLIKPLERLKEEIIALNQLDLKIHSSIEKLIEKSTKRSNSDKRTKIVTLNIDTLIEQAASRLRYVVVDGFSYTLPRVFDGTFFDYDLINTATQELSHHVFQLYKLHGSINWVKKDDTINVVDNPINPCIYFSDRIDYNNAFANPFFELVSRFQNDIRKPNTLLITVGYDFYDTHIANMIKNAVEVNRSLSLVIVDHKLGKPFRFYKDLTSVRENVILIKESSEVFIKNYPYINI